MQPNKLRRLAIEPLEPRWPLATTVLDLNPGPASSSPSVHAKFGDYVYVSADLGAGRRLLRTDGETFTDLGRGLHPTVIRGETLYGIEDITLNVETIDLPTGERATFSTERGASWVSGSTIGWYSNNVPTYHDIDGRNYSDWSQSYMWPSRVEGDSVYAVGMEGIYLCNVTCDLVITDEVFMGGNDGIELFVRGDDIYTPAGVSVGLRSDRYFPDTDNGWWTVRGDVLSHYVGAELEQWTIPGLKYVAYAAPDLAIAAVDVDGLGYDPFLVTTDVVKLGEMNSTNLGGWLVGDRIFIDNSLLLVGTQLIPMQAQAYPWHVTDKDIGFFWHESPETGYELATRLILAGDSNHDGVFDSGDLVQLFQLGEYEDALVGNSSWVSGDFNGDSEFSTADLVAAFALGTYRT